MESKGNKVMFRYNEIKERKLIPKYFNLEEVINFTRYGQGNDIENMSENQKKI